MTQLVELTPAELHQEMKGCKVVLVDVREPQEFHAERIPGALLFPLSSFDPSALPTPESCRIVFHCAGGKRSAMAVAKCAAQGIGHTAHLAGGIMNWKAAGLDTISG